MLLLGCLVSVLLAGAYLLAIVGLALGARASSRHGRPGLARALAAVLVAFAVAPPGCVLLHTPVSDRHGQVWKPRLVDALVAAWAIPVPRRPRRRPRVAGLLLRRRAERAPRKPAGRG